MAENTQSTSVTTSESRRLFGRHVILSSSEVITAENLIQVLQDAEAVHEKNRSDIQYLYNYYRGNQPILNRVKLVRPEINNKIVENRANEIVSFKTGYLCGEPIQYVSRNSDENTVEAVKILNDYMNAEDKASKDQEVIEWDMICGTAYRIVLPDPQGELDECPFEIYTLDPRNTYVVYSRELGNKPLLGVKYYRDTDNHKHYSVYTDNVCYTILDNQIVSAIPHALGMIPIVEYPANSARLGAFEIVLPLLDALNNVSSNRMDGIEQTVQAFLKFKNCDFKDEEIEQLPKLIAESGAVILNNTTGKDPDVDTVSCKLDQGQTQVSKKDIYDAILTICGMPNRNGGSSTSDTGSAVIMRDGWSDAEARAKDSEHMFKRSEKQMLKLVLKICRDLSALNLKLLDVETKFTRRNYENIQVKAQVLDLLLKNPKVHPLIAYQHSGMFSDAESAYKMGNDYYQEYMKQLEEQMQVQEVEEDNDDGDETVQTD